MRHHAVLASFLGVPVAAVLMLAPASEAQVSCPFAGPPPTIDGVVGAQEWAGAAAITLGTGTAYLLSDTTHLYVLLDVTTDTQDDFATDGEHFLVGFDSNFNGVGDPNVDNEYGDCYPNQSIALSQLKTTSCGFSGCLPTEAKSAHGFGPSPASSTRHTLWEMALPFSEIAVGPGDTVGMWFGTYSKNPLFRDESPTSECDWANYAEVTFAEALYLVPSVAHWPGAQGTAWRTDLSIVNHSGASAVITVEYYSGTDAWTASDTLTLGDGAGVSWEDVLVSRLGLASSSTSKGTLLIRSDRRLVVLARTYNATSAGSFGQYMPALLATDAVVQSQIAVLPHLSKSSRFRTNVGAVNLSTSGTCNVRVRLYNLAGTQLGSDVTLSVAAGRSMQRDDIFAAAGAGSVAHAYATAEVLTEGCRAWLYGSVVDEDTGDPTTVPLFIP